MASVPSDLGEAAFLYTQRNVAVFPLQPASKIPLKGSAGWKDATLDREQVERWWREEPRRNIGAVPGQAGLVVVDVDTAEQLEAWTRALDEKGDPGPTRITQSPSDPASRHYWYRSPTPVEFTKLELDLYREKVLLIGAGQYVLLPPSIHPVGEAYRFVDDQPAQLIPNWLAAAAAAGPRLHPNGKADDDQIDQWLREASATATNKRGQDAVSICIGEIVAASPGSRHETLKAALAGLLNRAGADGIEIDLEEALGKVRNIYTARFAPGERRHPHKELDHLLGWLVGERVKAGEEAQDQRIHAEGISNGKRRVIETIVLADVEPQEVTWLWRPYIPAGKLTLLEGDPGLGKSQATLAIASAVSVGFGLHGLEPTEPASVLLATAEDGLGDTVRPRVDALGGDVHRIHAINVPLVLDDAGLTLLDLAIAEIKPVLLILDPLVAYLGAAVDMHRANETRAVTAALARIAEERSCAILALRHLIKQAGGKAAYRGLGSIDLFASARSVLLAGVDPGDETRTNHAIAHIKSNLAPFGITLGYRLDPEKGFLWTGPSTLTTEDLLGGDESDESRGGREEAIEFLRVTLAGGPVRATDVMAQAEKLGIALRTLKRAKKQLVVGSYREGFDPGEWFWHLPDEEGQPRRGPQESDTLRDETTEECQETVAPFDEALFGAHGGDWCRCGRQVDRFDPAGYPYCEDCGPPP